jgi:ribosomal protein S27E
MQYDPEDLIIVRCDAGHEFQTMYDADVDDIPCLFCGGAVQEVKD